MSDVTAAAPSVDYPTKCLMCGADLAVLAVADVQSPPWACQPCGRAYWPAELRAAAQHDDLFDPTAGWLSDTRTYDVLAACDVDRLAAVDRGTSLLPEQLHLLDDDTLMFWRSRNLSDAMIGQIDDQLVRHGKPRPKPKPKPKAAR